VCSSDLFQAKTSLESFYVGGVPIDVSDSADNIVLPLLDEPNTLGMKVTSDGSAGNAGLSVAVTIVNNGKPIKTIADPSFWQVSTLDQGSNWHLPTFVGSWSAPVVCSRHHYEPSFFMWASHSCTGTEAWFRLDLDRFFLF